MAAGDNSARMYAAMELASPGAPLQRVLKNARDPRADELLLQVLACGVCRTDLHIVDGELAFPGHSVVPGHEIVARVVVAGQMTGFTAGERVGVPWLGWTCGACRFCVGGRENLCERARFTGWHIEGGYAGYAIADHRYCFRLPEAYSDVDAAPLLCAGLIGHRALRMAGDARRLGIYGFGAAAHLVAQVARHEGREVFAFTRSGDVQAQRFALELGASWAGASDQSPPEPLDAAILFAPVGALVPAALAALDKGGTVVCAGIHMSAIPAFAYELLWNERRIVSVANLTRADAEEFLRIAPLVPVRVSTTRYPLDRANEALNDLRSGALTGAAVLVP